MDNIWNECHEQYNEVNGHPDNKASFGQELLAGTAAFGAMHMYENHDRAEGNEVKHGFAKELLMGFVGGEVDKLAQTKGRDIFDDEEAKRKVRKRAQEKVSQLYDAHYGDDNNPGYNNNQIQERRDPHEYIQNASPPSWRNDDDGNHQNSYPEYHQQNYQDQPVY